MKNTVFILLCFIVGIGRVVPQELDNKVDWQGDYWQFGGFSFNGYDPSKDTGGLFPRIQAEADKVRDSSPADANFYFLGHSQGGLRSLAAAVYLKNNEPLTYDKLDAVITVSGIDRGIKALEGGVPYLRGKILYDYNILWSGTRSMVTAIPLIDIFEIFSTNGITNLIMDENPVKFLNKMFPAAMQDFVYVSIALQGQNVAMPEIDDMVPGSDFITQHVVKSDMQTRQARMLKGYRNVLKVGWTKFLFISVPYLYWAREPIYTVVNIYNGVEQLRIGEEMPVGYIAGLDNDVFGLVLRDADFSTNVTVKVMLVSYASGCQAAQFLHAFKTQIIWGLFTGSPAYYMDARNAYNYVVNIDDRLNNLLGSSQNDGLVALESQFYPKTVHGNVLLGGEKGYEGFPNHNHANIMGDPIPADVQARIYQMLTEVEEKRIRVTP